MAPIYAGLGQTESTNHQFAAQEALLEETKLGISFSSERRTIVDVKSA